MKVPNISKNIDNYKNTPSGFIIVFCATICPSLLATGRLYQGFLQYLIVAIAGIPILCAIFCIFFQSFQKKNFTL